MAGETGLVEINRLVLSDTFNSWFDTTNQIIDAINPMTIYGIDSSTGVNLISGASAGNYTGIKTIGLNPGHGIGYYGNNNEISLNYSGLSDGYTLAGPIVATGDYYAFTDVSDTTQNSTGTIKRVRASDMLPATINAPNGPNGTLTLEGNFTINGQLLVGGQNSFIASNDLRIEDKNIEIAYQQAGFVGITGSSLAKYPAAGTTAYFYEPGTTSTMGLTSAVVIGIVKSITGPLGGPTANMKIGSVFTRGGPELFTLNGYVQFSGTGSVGGGPTGTFYPIVAVAGNNLSAFTVDGPTTEFFNDTVLDGAGFTIRGASGDKTFGWSVGQKSMVSNVPLGVASARPDQYINSRYFRNYGLSADGLNDFNFRGTSSNAANTRISIGYDDKAVWSIEHDKTTVGNEPLLLKHATGPNATTNTLTVIRALTTGPLGITSTAGGSANMWADGFNAEYVNGAGATFNSAPNSIPVSDGRGRINDRWLEASSNRTKITQVGHEFTVGIAVSVDGNGNYIRANAQTYTDYSAEAVGIVESVIDADSFTLVTNGYISGIPQSVIGTAGEVYFLSAVAGETAGGLTTGEPTALNNVRKPMFYSTSLTGGFVSGYVLSYPGQIISAGASATDQVYLDGIVPIGSIQQYSGSYAGANQPNSSWIPCDGRAIAYQSYIDLYDTIGNVYYARGIVTSAAGVSNPVIAIERGTRGLEVADLITLVADNGTQTGGVSWKMAVVSVNSSSITLTADAAGPETKVWTATGLGLNSNVRIYGRVDTSSGRGLLSTFFIPDMRARYGVGGITGAFVGMQGNGTGLTTGTTGGSTGGFLGTNYILRAVKTSLAAIVVGHQHDDRYLFKTSSDTHSGGGITFSGGPYVFQNTGATAPALQVNTGSSNFVGIGTATPTQKLSVVDGTIRVDNDVSPLTLILRGLGSNLQVGHDGTSICSILNSGTGYGGFDFKGNLGSTLRMDGAGNVTIGNGNVGVGTTTPATRLHVKSGGEGLRLETTATTGVNYLTFYAGSTIKSYIGQNSTNDDLYVINVANNPLYLGTNNSKDLTILAGGQVGIGTTNPLYNLVIGAPSGNCLEFGLDTSFGVGTNLISSYNRTGTNAGTYSKLLAVANSYSLLINGNNEKVTIDSSGRVGIGTTTPNSTLEIVGSVAISGGIGKAYFHQPQFNTSSIQDIGINLTLQPSYFPMTPSSVFTIDPGGGIKILTGNTVTVVSGFTWKIM